ncbi:NIPSNAP family protein [Asticcacaulis biprosthecium C19]|uniref:NIPSNAP family protein n=1 Tax=Asticcacaulis biprosthecium C19 TaxID=715226 RepID=F4QPM7_9CAUL|nr:NIPSNAP family protein [Asticcacaulis biprosthecium]EGF91285.1 NIPSNAP family protein [Asticcacaulis biprosthecium C19]
MTTLARSRPGILFRYAAAIIIAAIVAVAAWGTRAESLQPPQIGMYELRIDTAAEGKMAELDARFRDHTIGLFRKHGMTPIAVFHPANPDDHRLIYLIGYKDRDARDAAWNAFDTDPERTRVDRASQAKGALTTRTETLFLVPTDYSPVLDLTSATPPRYFELRTYTTRPGRLENLHTRFRDHTLGLFTKHGMTNLLYWRPTGDQPELENKMIYLMAYSDKDARDASWAAFGADAAWKKVAADSQVDGPILTATDGVVSVEMKPTDYSPLN